MPPLHWRSCSRKCLRKSEIEERPRRFESGISTRRCQLCCNCQLNTTAPHLAVSVGISQAVTATRSAEFVAGFSRQDINQEWNIHCKVRSRDSRLGIEGSQGLTGGGATVAVCALAIWIVARPPGTTFDDLRTRRVAAARQLTAPWKAIDALDFQNCADDQFLNCLPLPD